MDEPDAKAHAEAQHLALLAEHLLARAACWDGAASLDPKRAEGLRRIARRACVGAVATLAAVDQRSKVRGD